MLDLLLGVFIIGLGSALLFIMSVRASRTLSDRLTHLLGIMIVTLIVGFVVHVQGHVALSHLLPFSNLIVISNWQPLMVAVLAGLLWHRLPGGAFRRSGMTFTLVGACLLSIYRPIFAQPPRMLDSWEGQICMQTSQASCTPAAAATLLAQYQIPTTEQEMAMLCLTSQNGTPMQGLYRGLKLKTENTPYEPYMFYGAGVDDLRGVGPVLISVELRESRRERHLDTWGWIPGVSHSIVVLGFLSNDVVLIADPAIGLEIWSIEDLRILWHGEGARLVRSR